MKRTFDCRLGPGDPRNWPLKAALTTDEIVSWTWNLPKGAPILDQGPDGACVGFGCTNALRLRPRAANIDLGNTYAKEVVYWLAQRLDFWPGGSYPGALPHYEGSSLDAGIHALWKVGWMRQFRYAEKERDIARGIRQIGPAIMATNWMTGMMQPDADGYIHATGDVEGGHCYDLRGYSVKRDAYPLLNSWGATWGENGSAWIKRADVAKLLADRGQAAFLIEKFATPLPPPEW